MDLLLSRKTKSPFIYEDKLYYRYSLCEFPQAEYFDRHHITQGVSDHKGHIIWIRKDDVIYSKDDSNWYGHIHSGEYCILDLLKYEPGIERAYQQCISDKFIDKYNRED